MTERHLPTDLVDTREQPDRDIGFNWIYVLGAVLVVTTVVFAVLSWPFAKGLLAGSEARDPLPSPLVEANTRALPPAPRLQPDPPLELEVLRAREDALLEGWGWVDRNAGIARIPVERAIELSLEEGLPRVPNPRPGGQR